MMSRCLWWMQCTSGFLAVALLWACAASAAQLPSDNRASDKRAESPNATFTIAGRVVSSSTGTPLDKARVSIADVRSRQQEVWVITSEDGHFEFTGLRAGKYNLQGAKRGYLTAAYDQHEQFSTAIVTGSDFATDNLVLRLTPLAFLSGKVIDDFGDPVRHAEVSLFVKNTRAGATRVTRASSDTTDDQGYFEFPGVAPGEYFLSASGTPWYAVHPAILSQPGAPKLPSNVPASLDVVYPTTYYNGATEADGATPISMKAGERVQTDIHLNAVPSLHLIIRIPEQAQTQEQGPWHGYNSPMLQKHVFESMEGVNIGTQSTSPGVWEMIGLAPGRYTVTHRGQETNESTELVLGENSQEVDLSHAEPAAKVKLRASLSPGEPPPKRLFLSLRDSRGQTTSSSMVDGNGEVSFDSVPPGKYSVLAGASDKPYAVARMSSAGGEIAGRELNIAAGASLDLTVFLAGGVVSIEGFVKRADKPAAGVMVALVPDPPSDWDWDTLRRDQSDFDGSFALRGVIPGSYTVVAIEEAWGFEWREPEALARYLKKGQTLTVGPLMKGSVQLPDAVQVQPR